jgi:poly(hydroxyalkanoate) depolymerase family esterase
LRIAFADHLFLHFFFEGTILKMVLAALSRRIKKMKSILHDVLRKAVKLTARQNLVEATRVIQTALSGESRRKDAQFKSVDAREHVRPTKPAAADIGSAFAQLQKGLAAPHASAEGARKALPMGEVLTLLHKGVVPGLAHGLKPHLRPQPQVPTPKGAQFLSRTYSCAAGSRDYKLFVPSKMKSKAKGRKLPLIVMLHGCTQNPDDFALGTGMNELAEERCCFVAYPRQSTSSNQMACWNWFNVKDQTRDSGEPSILAGMTREIMAEFNVDSDRVFVAGLSAGGAMAAILGATYPDLFHAAGIHSGLPYGAAADVASAFSSMRNGASIEAVLAAEMSVRTIVFHGDADRTVHPSNGELIVAAARAGLDAAVEKTQKGRAAGGVAYKRIIIADSRGAPQVEYWAIEGMGHAWSGGHPEGSYTNPRGPDASREMLRFFLA